MANATAADATPPWCCLFEKRGYCNAFLIYGHSKIVSNMLTFVVVTYSIYKPVLGLNETGDTLVPYVQYGKEVPAYP